VPLDGGALASEQELCLPYGQVDFYPDQGTLERGLEIWRGSSQGEVRIVHGGNWMVVDLTEVATGEPAPADLKALADELGAEYAVVGG
jgi:hypothetical protein